MDAGYISFGASESGESKTQISVYAPQLLDRGEIVIDVDWEGRILGIELIGVKQLIARPRLIPEPADDSR